MTLPSTPSHSPSLRVIDGHGTDETTWNGSSHVMDMPTLDPSDWVDRYRALWVLAPHPDDEILGLGGSLSRLSARGATIHIVSVTDGEASHAGSTRWTPQRLATARPAELRQGLERLGIDAEVTRLSLPDGRVGGHRQELLKALVDTVGHDDLLLTTCRFDGHPDHEACGDVAFLTGELTGATVLEYPVWMWHWASPADAVVPWTRAHRLPLDPQTLSRKAAAIGEFVSQIEPDGASEAILPEHVVARFERPFEVIFV